jgi:DNA-binding MarR family transcriptional regulator
LELNWLGRYRVLVEAIVKHRNLYARALKTKFQIMNDVYLTLQEWMVLEYIIEHESDDDSMTRISERLEIPQSSFSKYSKLLRDYKLVAKYQMVGNRKDIILKPTEKGIEVYRHYANELSKTIFGRFFSALESFSDDDLTNLTKAIEALNYGLDEDPAPKTIKTKLIKLE